MLTFVIVKIGINSARTTSRLKRREEDRREITRKTFLGEKMRLLSRKI
jgi:hypothetical protein